MPFVVGSTLLAKPQFWGCGACLLIEEAADGSKCLSFAEQGPTINIVAIDRRICFEEWAESCNTKTCMALAPHLTLEKRPRGDMYSTHTDIAIGYALPRLIVSLIQHGGRDTPEIVVPRYVGKTRIIY